jgi:hypothetical protein
LPSTPTRRIAGFALRFAVVYAVLVLAWPVLRSGFRPLYCGLGNLVLSGVDGSLGEGTVRFHPLDTPADLDIQLVLTKRGPPPVTARMENSSRLVGYLPLVSLIALVLASPIAWKRRRRALLLGIPLVAAFVAVRMAIPIRRDFSRADALQLHDPGPFARWLLGVAERALLEAPASFFVVPILIWVVVAFRREDWALVGRAGSSPD